MTAPALRFDGAEDAPWTLVLAHGAGAGMDSPFLVDLSGRLARADVRVARFEFPYMAARRRGERRPPDRVPVLRATWMSVVAAVRQRMDGRGRLAIGGKSMGGRIASMVADEAATDALVCIGYPFHPPRQPARLRTAHLATLRTPTLIVQGERDAFGSRAEVGGYALAPAIEIVWAPDGDHSLAPRAASGRTLADNLAFAADAVVRFLARAPDARA
ncbi:MAG TPA: alpha/beta family hydrolase [Planctomycetota bacterium]|nr:alpha/beta family hydrolase [Planctomycetota bacterium]